MGHYKQILNARTIFYFMDLASFSQYPNAIHFCCFGFSFTNKAAENLNFKFNQYFSSNFSGTGTAHSGGEVSVHPFHFVFLEQIHGLGSRKAVPIYPLIDTFSPPFFIITKNN